MNVLYFCLANWLLPRMVLELVGKCWSWWASPGVSNRDDGRRGWYLPTRHFQQPPSPGLGTGAGVGVKSWQISRHLDSLIEGGSVEIMHLPVPVAKEHFQRSTLGVGGMHMFGPHWHAVAQLV